MGLQRRRVIHEVSRYALHRTDVIVWNFCFGRKLTMFTEIGYYLKVRTPVCLFCLSNYTIYFCFSN